MIEKATNQNLLQLTNVLQQLTNQQFTAPLDVLNGSTIGMHVRHILEFYICLMNSVTTLSVNYDDRKRDITLETNTKNCIEAVTKILEFVNAVKKDLPIKLSANYSIHNESDKVTLNSSLFRELLYNVEHTVHHLAIIKIGLKALDNNIKVDESFGVASSTIRNKKICAQ
ncbi:DinB family protein [Abyssalbus ytuae]|uniref:DinB family protein n=1 Tax=Abyssalbus ytuae TaxID=2926907 RepID=A0A9E6ZSY0_9FLAO|nr:DinB family protein [Abyssalbus ytuae]UOB18258.1 DinB family protein [Abyssalbus ytuae]